MRKIIFALLLMAVLAAGGVLMVSPPGNLFTYSFCDKPIHYRVDTVDPRFKLSRENFLSDINQAVLIWDKGTDKDLFVYDPKGDLSINLIYDERQSLTSRINQMKSKVESEKQVLNPQVSEYKKISADFKQKIADLNSQIEFWNSKGGAPPDEYEQLTKQQQSLQAEADNLNVMARSLNISTESYNSEVGQLNQTINTFNNALEQRPEEGIFKGPENRIEIYFNISNQELIHTLAHELGHALGIGHVGDPAAIMYPKTSQKIILTDEDKLALKEVCRRYTIFELFERRLSQIISRYQLDKILGLSTVH